MLKQTHDLLPTTRRRGPRVSAVAAGVALTLAAGLGVSSRSLHAQAPPATSAPALDYSQMHFWKTLPPPTGTPDPKDPDSAYGLAFTSDNTLAVGYWPDTPNHSPQIALWDTQAGTATSPGKMGGTSWLNVHALAASPNGSNVAVVGFDNRGSTGRYVLLVFDAATGSIVDPAGMQSGQFRTFVSTVAYSPDGRRIAVGCGEPTVRPGAKGFHVGKAHPVDNNITVWDASGAAGPLAVGTGSDVWSLAFTPDGTGLSYGQTEHISQWALKPGGAFRGTAPKTLTEAEDTDAFNALVYAQDGGGFFTAIRTDSGTDRIERRDAATGNPTLTLLDPSGKVAYLTVQALALSPDGSVLAVGGQDTHGHGIVTLWDAHTGALLGAPLPTHDDQVHALAFSPGGHVLACGSSDGAVKLWTVNG